MSSQDLTSTQLSPGSMRARGPEDSATVFVPPELYQRMLEQPMDDHGPASVTSLFVKGPPARTQHAEPEVAVVAAPPVEPQPEQHDNVTLNGTIMMQAQPFKLGGGNPLDEMSMVLDINQMRAQVATAAPRDLARYVDELRAAQGIPPASAQAPAAQPSPPLQDYAPRQVSQHPSQPPPAWAAPMPPPPHVMTTHAPAPIVSWTPTSCPFAQPQAAQPYAQAGGGPASSSPLSMQTTPARQKHSAVFLACLFTVMFVMTAVGVGALTYVAMRSHGPTSTTTTAIGG